MYPEACTYIYPEGFYHLTGVEKNNDVVCSIHLPKSSKRDVRPLGSSSEQNTAKSASNTASFKLESTIRETSNGGTEV